MLYSVNKALVLARMQGKKGIETTISCSKCNDIMMIGRT